MGWLEDLIQQSILKTPNIIRAFEKIKRLDFVLPGDEALALENAPLPIGFGQTISQPLTVAFMLELLAPAAGEKTLDVGCGSGWTTALLAETAGPNGSVFGLEILPELAAMAATNIAKYGFIDKGIVRIESGDGYDGLPKEAPFDKIIVSAAAPVVPNKLLKQLKIGGRLVMPLGKRQESQAIVAIEKQSENKFARQSYPGFVFVPLVNNDHK